MRRTALLFIFLFLFLSTISPVFASTIDNHIAFLNAQIMLDNQPMGFEIPPIIERGRTFVPAKIACQYLNVKFDWYSENGLFDITQGDKVITLGIGDKAARVNGELQDVGVTPFLMNGTVMMPLRFVVEKLGGSINIDPNDKSLLINSKGGSTTNPGSGEVKQYKVVIDPGHGGYDPGAIKSGINEKDLNLDIAKRLNTLLAAEGIKTYMTRTDDSFVDLYPRTDMANEVKADLFISIHNNSDKSSAMAGTMSLYCPTGYDTGDKFTGKDLAKLVQKGLTNMLGTKDLGIIARPNLVVLRASAMPAVIAEVGYTTNKNELNKLKTKDFRQKAAEALRDAVVEAFKKV